MVTAVLRYLNKESYTWHKPPCRRLNRVFKAGKQISFLLDATAAVSAGKMKRDSS